jgi:RNA polymerase sigma factor (sigma-70 family)
LHDGDVLHVLMVSHFVLDRMRLNNQITLSRFRLQNDTISEVTKRERDDMQQKQQDEDELDQNADSLSLYDRYGQAIFAYARLHVPSREDAEDVTLEVFTAALENDNFSGLQEGEKLAWLRRVARNKLVDIYRRSTNHPDVALNQVMETVFDDEASTPEQIMLQREVREHLYRAIRTLSMLQQQVLRLRYGDGLHFGEIAVLLHKREEAVRKLHSRALALLRTKYKLQTVRGDR